MKINSVEDLKIRIQKINPKSGESVIVWVDELGEKQLDSIIKWVDELKKHWPFTIFLIIPGRNVIRGIKTYELETLYEQLKNLTTTIESILLSKK